MAKNPAHTSFAVWLAKIKRYVGLFKNIDFPLTRDIEELIELAEESNIELPSNIKDAGILTPYAVET